MNMNNDIITEKLAEQQILYTKVLILNVHVLHLNVYIQIIQ